MALDTKTLTRKELYDLVWSKPIIKLAEEFGLSDRGLAKICTRHRIPTPPRGYWAKLTAGKKAKQTIFTQVDDPYLDRITIASTLSKLPEETREILRKAKIERASKSKAIREKKVLVTVFEHIDKPHKSIVGTVKRLRKLKSDENGEVSAIGSNLCGIIVHLDSVERVISILDKLVNVISDLGFRFSGDGKHVVISTEKDSISFTLNERTKRVKHEPTEQELAAYEKKKLKFSTWEAQLDDFSVWRREPWPEFDVVFTGQLAFVIDGWSDGLRKTWADGKTQTIESLFDEIVAGIQVNLENVKFRREEREENDIKNAELARRRGLAHKRKEREDKRVEFLNELMVKKIEADRIRTWLETCSTQEVDESDPDIFRMMDWARSRLSEFDEFSNPNVISLKLEYNELFPRTDELFDPEGDPPDRYGYY